MMASFFEIFIKQGGWLIDSRKIHPIPPLSRSPYADDAPP